MARFTLTLKLMDPIANASEWNNPYYDVSKSIVLNILTNPVCFPFLDSYIAQQKKRQPLFYLMAICLRHQWACPFFILILPTIFSSWNTETEMLGGGGKQTHETRRLNLVGSTLELAHCLMGITDPKTQGRLGRKRKSS